MSGSDETVTVASKLPMPLKIEMGDRSHVLKGARHSRLIGGAGINENVPKDLWDAWQKKHADSDLVKKGIVFSAGSKTNTEAKAAEMSAEKSGFEPLDPLKPAPGVEPTEEQVKSLPKPKG